MATASGNLDVLPLSQQHSPDSTCYPKRSDQCTGRSKCPETSVVVEIPRSLQGFAAAVEWTGGWFLDPGHVSCPGSFKVPPAS